MPKQAVTNIGQLVSGDLHRPLLDADTVLIENGVITAIGRKDELDMSDVDSTVDVDGMTVAPGLIDPHVHPVFGDWTPRQMALGWMEGALHAGVTTMISQGTPHLSGRVREAIATKCSAILAAKTYANFRPGGALKMHGGAVMLEAGLNREDFREMAENGVELVAEIGGSGISRPDEVREMVEWARELGMKIPVHFGGRSVPGSARIWADDLLAIGPDVVVHINGGCTAAPWPEVERVLESPLMVEVIFTGNPLVMHRVVEWLKARNQLHRLLVGSDTPIGHGVIPLAIIRTVVIISAMNQLPAAHALCFATGNTTKAYGLQEGLLSAGRPADLITLSQPNDSAGRNALEAIELGDIPAITLVMVDGRPVMAWARNTPLTDRRVTFSGNYPRLPDWKDLLSPQQVLLPALVRG